MANGGVNGMVQKSDYVVDESGYNFMVAPGDPWRIEVEKDDRCLNGVTVNDLSLLIRHVNGLQLIENPYKLVAADVNGDKQIDIRDVVELRKLLLGIITSLENQPPWRFFDANYDFPAINEFSLPSDVYNVVSDNEKLISPLLSHLPTYVVSIVLLTKILIQHELFSKRNYLCLQP